jgi:hypothetical protein
MAREIHRSRESDSRTMAATAPITKKTSQETPKTKRVCDIRRTGLPIG